MLRAILVATVALVACKDSKDQGASPASPPGSAKVAAPATPAAPPPPAAKVDPPKPSAPVVTKTGVADFELVEHDGVFTVRDDSYEITFPIRPTVNASTETSPTGVDVKTASALVDNEPDDIYGAFWILLPKGVPYDVEGGTNGARDGMLKNINGKLVDEKPFSLSGLAGRKVTATAMAGGNKMNIELYLAWDEGHRVMTGLFVAGVHTPTAAQKAYAASFKVNAKGKAPPR